MAASALPEPGTKFGPCKTECKHRDCASTRKVAADICRICGEAIGYDRAFYRDDEAGTRFVHAACYEDEVEEQQKAQRA